MIRAAILFFILAIISYVIGAYGIAGLSIEIAKVFLYVFVALALISFIGAMLTNKNPKSIL